jgi:hypothetical protein
MSAPQFRVLEQLDTFTPLGIRFWDPALDRAIVDGLQVIAWPLSSPNRQIAATRSRSDVFTFRWLPGMRPIEHRYPDPDFFDASVPQRRPFIVTVTDLRSRYLPAAFRVDLPLPYGGVFLAEGSASIPDAVPRGVYLFSAPSRRTSELLTAVRGELVDEATRAAVPWAHVIVSAPHGAVFHGLADEAGRFSVFMPFPSLEEGFGGSPGSFGHGTPIGERGWDITLAINAQPGTLATLPGTPLPDYRSVLGQLPADIWSTEPDPSVLSAPQLSLRLRFGEELIVRTANLSQLLVTPAPLSP